MNKISVLMGTNSIIITNKGNFTSLLHNETLKGLVYQEGSHSGLPSESCGAVQRGSVEGSIAHRDFFVLVPVYAGQPTKPFKWAGARTHQNTVHWGNPSAAPPSACTRSGSGGPIRWTGRHLWEKRQHYSVKHWRQDSSRHFVCNFTFV